MTHLHDCVSSTCPRLPDSLFPTVTLVVVVVVVAVVAVVVVVVVVIVCGGG